MEEFNFISPTDRPALLVISTPEWRNQCSEALSALGYKVHSVDDHAQFHARFNQINYRVIIIDETFCGTPEDNIILKSLQTMQMAYRRHATILLLGATFETLNSLQAFEKSVHCVVNYSEMPLIGQLIEKTVSENQNFLAVYNEVQKAVHVKTK